MRTLLALLALSHIAAAAEAVKPHPVNPHYFLFRGKPLIIVSSAEHYGAVLNLDFDWKKYLDTMSGDGMNYVRIFSGAYVETPGDFNIERNSLAPPQSRFLAPWQRIDGKFDLSKFEPAYLNRLKEFVAAAGERGIIVELTLFCATYSDKQWSVSPFNAKNNVNSTGVTDYKKLHTKDNGNVLGFQEMMTRRIVHELNGFDNVIYEIQNEPWADRTVVAGIIHPYNQRRWPNTADIADEASLEWQQTVASWIRNEESVLPTRHTIAWNICNFRYPMRQMIPGTDTVNFHYAYPEAALWNYGLNVPIGYDETGFAGKADTTYRGEAWRFLLAGGGLFNHLDYSFSPGHETGDDSQEKSPGGGSPALRKQFRVLSEFLHAMPFLRMRPDQSCVLHAPGAVAQALSAHGEAYAIYLNGSGSVDLLLQLPAGRYTAQWVSPLDGSVLGSKQLDHRGGPVKIKSPEFTDDIALRIRK
jgi:hypothetical protein